MDYPKHLSEKIREEVAVSYMKHELRKIFPSIDTKEVDNLMKNKELNTPRDFWNGLHGISMGFKLKNILFLATAENITWQKLTVDITDITFGVELAQTKKIREGKISAQEFADYYKNNLEEKKTQLEATVELRGNDFVRENDPIIALERKEGDKNVISVHDGNGRLSRHLLEDKKTIDVYLGKMTGEKLLNFWIPTQLMIDILFFTYEAVKNKDDELLMKYSAVLNDIIKNFDCGKDEFLERALTNKKELREKMLGVMGIIGK